MDDVTGNDDPSVPCAVRRPLDFMDELPLLVEPKLVVPPISMPAIEPHARKLILEDVGVNELDVAIVVSAQQLYRKRCAADFLPLTAGWFCQLKRLQPGVMRRIVSAETVVPVRGCQRVGGRRKTLAVPLKVRSVLRKCADYILSLIHISEPTRPY